MWRSRKKRIAELEKLVSDLRDKNFALDQKLKQSYDEYQEVEALRRHFKQAYDDILEAQDKGCNIGDYCEACVYGITETDFIFSSTPYTPTAVKQERTVCGYKRCKHLVEKPEFAPKAYYAVKN